jgi:hypothetical protein
MSLKIVIASLLVLGCGDAGGVQLDAAPDAPQLDASAEAFTDAAAPSLATGVQVLFPPAQGAPGYSSVQTHLMTNAAVAGAVINVDWSDFDLGNGQYDFSIPDAAIAPWESAGKKVALVIQNTPYGGDKCPSMGMGSRGVDSIGNCSLPPWVWTALTPSNYVTCVSPTGTQRAPNFRSPIFIQAYQAAIAAFVAHYGARGSIEYVRVGLGKGGEINIPTGWDDTTTACGQSYSGTWGYTVGTSAAATWNAYLQAMVEFEGSLNSPKPLFVSITPVQTNGVAPNAVPDFLAPIAVAHGVGFGNQGLQYSDVQNAPKCGGDWCALFGQYAGQVPLELQTFGQSCPAGAGQCTGTSPTAKLSNATGSLVPLVPFAVQHKVTTLEIYYQDWLIAYDPSNADYATYGASYRSALEAASQSL